MKRYHVVRNPDGWQVRSSDHDANTVRNYSTKEEAVEAARKVAQSSRGVLLVYDRKGSIQREWTYVDVTGKGEPLPPRDSRTGSFTTRKSTTAIKSNVGKFARALESLAKK